MDSPALNPHSRMVLIPLAASQLPSSVVSVSGPGPVESHSSNLIDGPPPPPASEKHSSNPQADENRQEEPDGDAGSDQEAEPGNAGNDPYANLDGAFGNYLADQPRPIGATDRRARNDLDDLLF